MRGEGGGPLPRTLAMVEEEEELPQRQPPPIKIPKFKGENDPNLYIEWEQKMDQIFNIHLVGDQEQVDLVVLEFEDYAMTWWHQLKSFS